MPTRQTRSPGPVFAFKQSEAAFFRLGATSWQVARPDMQALLEHNPSLDGCCFYGQLLVLIHEDRTRPQRTGAGLHISQRCRSLRLATLQARHNVAARRHTRSSGFFREAFEYRGCAQEGGCALGPTSPCHRRAAEPQKLGLGFQTTELRLLGRLACGDVTHPALFDMSQITWSFRCNSENWHTQTPTRANGIKSFELMAGKDASNMSATSQNH